MPRQQKKLKPLLFSEFQELAGTFQAEWIAAARLKELTPSMPVIFIKAIPVDRQGDQEHKRMPGV
ncbi:UNVERIFIED_CONTAM: hypothetical protein FKN15_022829 [Acipenser sinensis]